MKIKVKRKHMKVRAARKAKRPAKRTSTSAQQRDRKLTSREQRTKRSQDQRWFDESPRMWVREDRRNSCDYWLDERACRLSDRALENALKVAAAASSRQDDFERVAYLLTNRWYDRRHFAAMMAEIAPEAKV